VAGLKALGEGTSLIADDPRVRALLGGVTQGLRTELQNAGSLGQLQAREDLLRRIAASIIRGGAGAVADNPDLFVRGEGPARALVGAALVQMLDGLRQREDLFSNEALEDLFGAALRAVAADPALFGDRKLVREVLGRTLAALTSGADGTSFPAAAVIALARSALEMVAAHPETLIDPRRPERQLIAGAAAAIARGLGAELAGGVQVRNLLSAGQLVALGHAVFAEVARSPETLLAGVEDDARRTVLAQVLGSVAAGLGPEPLRLASGATFVALAQSALAVASRNRDKLLDLRSADPRTNLLYEAIEALARAAFAGDDRRGLLDRNVFLDTATRVLREVSAHYDPGAHRIAAVGAALRTALALSAGELRPRINGHNLPLLAAGLLRGTLLGELSLEDEAAAARWVRTLLRASA
jgi:hypothetical protein